MKAEHRTGLFRLILFLVIGSHVLLGSSRAAEVPGLLSHQGRIAVNGLNFDGLGKFKFALINGAGDTTFWSNDGSSSGGGQPTTAVDLSVTQGHYSVLLGASPMLEIPASVFSDNSDVRLRIWFSSDDGTTFELLTPDRRITPVGFALFAKTAQSVANDSITSASIADGSISALDLSEDIGVWNLSAGNISFNGGDVGLGANLELPATTATTGIIRSGESDTLMHTFGVENVFLGVNAGNLTMTGRSNTAVGMAALQNTTTGWGNTVVGKEAMYENTVGRGNSAFGLRALFQNTEGIFNTAMGDASLAANTAGNRNTALGQAAMNLNTTGSSNLSAGEDSLKNNTTGNYNIALGHRSGINLTTGNHNIAIGNSAVANESSTIRIGDSDQTRAFIAGIHGVVPAQNDPRPVIVDSNGQLGSLEGITVSMLSPDLRHMLGLFDVSEGLVAWYRFDGSGDDSSGNELHGSEVGTVAYSTNRFGESGSALSGVTGIDEANRIEGAGLDLAGISHSISFWLRTNYDGDGSNGNWLFRVGSESATGKALHLSADYGAGLSYSFFFDDFNIATSVSDQSWHHVVVTFDQGSLQRKVFIDGTLDSANTAARGFSGNSDFAFLMVSGVQVDLDEVRFYNRVLPPEEVSFLFEKVR